MPWDGPFAWLPAVLISAGLAIWGKQPRRYMLHWFFKPFTTGLIGLMGAAFLPESSAVAPWLMAAIGLSLLGDVFLMLGPHLFFPGLVAFGVALNTYAIAFSMQVPFAPRQLVYGILPTALGVFVLKNLWPQLGRMRLPVALYAASLCFMSWRAISRFDAIEVPLNAWLVGCVGAGLFLFADTYLAKRRFANEPGIPYAVELGAYYGAQWCLVASTVVAAIAQELP